MAEEKVYIDSDTLVEVTKLRDAESGDYVNDATIKMSLFKGDEKFIDICELVFDSGGVAEPVENDVIKGATSNATAKIKGIVLASGAWAEGDAVGRFEIVDQLGTFQENESLNLIDGQANIATVNMSGLKTIDVTPTAGGTGYTAGDILTLTEGTGGQVKVLTLVNGGAVATLQIFPVSNGTGYSTGAGKAVTGGTGGDDCTVNVTAIEEDSTGAETGADDDSETKLRIRNHGKVAGDYIYIQGTVEYDGFHTISSVELDKITIPVAFAAEKFIGEEPVFVGVEGGTDISLTHEEGDDDGYYDGILPEDMVGLVNDDYYWRTILITKDTSILFVKQRCRAIYFLEVD